MPSQMHRVATAYSFHLCLTHRHPFPAPPFPQYNRNTVDGDDETEATGAQSEEDREEYQPTDVVMVPTQPTDVSLWSLGSFRLKGLTELMRVVQMVPTSLEGRMSALPKGGALDKVGWQACRAAAVLNCSCESVCLRWCVCGPCVCFCRYKMCFIAPTDRAHSKVTLYTSQNIHTKLTWTLHLTGQGTLCAPRRRPLGDTDHSPTQREPPLLLPHA